MRNELKKAMRNGNAYDYIANHYWEMDKEELKEVFCEFNFQVRFDDEKNCRELEKRTVKEIEENE